MEAYLTGSGSVRSASLARTSFDSERSEVAPPRLKIHIKSGKSIKAGRLAARSLFCFSPKLNSSHFCRCFVSHFFFKHSEILFPHAP
jgi:hypothetical protein